MTKFTNKSIYIHKKDKKRITDCAETLNIKASEFILCSLEYVNVIGRGFIINDDLPESPIGENAIRWGIRVSDKNVQLIKHLTSFYGYDENTSMFIVNSMLTIISNKELLDKVFHYYQLRKSLFINYKEIENDKVKLSIEIDKYPVCLSVLTEIKTKCELLIDEINFKTQTVS